MTADTDLFKQINNAVLDLQASHPQTFERPLKALSRLLHHENLEAINRSLTEIVDFDAFMNESESTGRSMHGSHKLVWPEDDKQRLGLTLVLIDKLASDTDYAVNIGHRYFYSGNNSIISGVHALTRQVIIPFVRDYKDYVLKHANGKPMGIVTKSNKVFIVHGHDNDVKNEVARFLGKIGLEEIILHERPNIGRHLLTKFQDESEGASFAVVLMTPDDEGGVPGSPPRKRARQNVVFELGFFIGKLGASHVAALVKGDVKKPSDFDGVAYIPLDPAGGWKALLARELKAAKVPFDHAKVIDA